MGEIGLLQIGVDPEVLRRHQTHRAGVRERRRLGDEECAGLQRFHSRHHAREGRANHGVIELALGLVSLRLGREILRMLLHRRLRLPAQTDERRLGLTPQGLDLLLGGL